MARTRFLVALSVGLSGLAACAGPRDYLGEADFHFQRSEYIIAHDTLLLAQATYPDDPEIEKRLRRIRLPYLLKLAQSKVFRNEDEEALEILSRVQVLDPGNAVAERWIAKAKEKLAMRNVVEGDEHRVSGDLELALEKYHNALTYKPGFAWAEEGKQLLTAEWERRRQRANEHYLEGVRTLAEQQFAQTTYHMGIALEKDPSLELARRPKASAARSAAEQRYRLAQKMQDAGFFRAALQEYKALAAQHPDLPELEARIEHMKRESEADDIANRGEMAVFRNDFVEGRRLLEEAYELSISQRDSIGEKLAVVLERELDARYVNAKDLELQNQFEEAIAAYKTIDEAWSGGFRDVKARISQLEESVAAAAESYAAAVAAEETGDKAAAIDAYGDALLYHPGYKDAQERRERLRLEN